MSSKTRIKVYLTNDKSYVFEMDLNEFDIILKDSDKYFAKNLIRIGDILINPEQITSVVQFRKGESGVESFERIF
ncbi:hypothetical protein AT258_03695 [Bacillus wiedmannii]|uniref:hypothetical protein n=1 Tax=Bacillus TaxID=1386 RepID=UPI00077AA2D0|nr:hypothetical protein [Bacillus mobilis]KXY79974.1 hypothetical protein AT258_03695 [Bacillus wiedmannii]